MPFCPACHGTGEAGGATPPKCEVCDSTGRITHSRRDDKEHVLIQHITTCTACGGQGFTHVHPCPQCDGRGDMFLRIKVQVPERLMGPERDLYEKLRGLGIQLEH